MTDQTKLKALEALLAKVVDGEPKIRASSACWATAAPP